MLLYYCFLLLLYSLTVVLLLLSAGYKEQLTAKFADGGSKKKQQYQNNQWIDRQQDVSRYQLFCIVLYSSIYIAPLNSRAQTEALLVRLAPRKESFKK